MRNIDILLQMGYQVEVACNFAEGNTCAPEPVSYTHLRSIHEEMIDIIKGNRVFWEGTIGGKRLIERLKKRHGHFADVIVADALYLNAPFILSLIHI